MVNQLKLFFSKRVKYDFLDIIWYKISDTVTKKDESSLDFYSLKNVLYTGPLVQRVLLLRAFGYNEQMFLRKELFLIDINAKML